MVGNLDQFSILWNILRIFQWNSNVIEFEALLLIRLTNIVNQIFANACCSCCDSDNTYIGVAFINEEITHAYK